MGALHQPGYQYIGMIMNWNVSPMPLQYLTYKFTHAAIAPAFKLLCINMVQLHHTWTPHMKWVVSTEENYSHTSVIHLYSNHCQFTLVCNTSASMHAHVHTHTHTYTKCPICHSTQTELTFQVHITMCSTHGGQHSNLDNFCSSSLTFSACSLL
jgi:hypothetical protein